MIKHECSVCGYVYDKEKGDNDGGIKAGTTFEELPEDWTCPVCRSEKSVFIEKEVLENIAPQNDTRIEEKINEADYDDNSNCGTCDL